jgi:hypothetical protein
MTYRVKLTWDSEAMVWIATSDDVPGLVLESGSFDALVERVRMAVPELIELNGKTNHEYRLKYLTEREDMVPAEILMQSGMPKHF